MKPSFFRHDVSTCFVTRLALVVLAGLLAIGGLGCQRETAPPLIQVLDVAPREVEVGDRLEVLGGAFPQGKTAHLVFRGTLFRPGEKPETDAVIATEGSAQSRAIGVPWVARPGASNHGR